MSSGQNIAESLATELRIFGRILQETVKGFKRSGWMNAVIVITMASILSIFSTIMASVLETQLFMQNIGSTLKLSVYLDDEHTLDDINARILRLPHVRDTETITKEDAWVDVKKIYEIPDIENPLPNTIHVSVAEQRYLERVYQHLKLMPGVIKVNYPQRVLRNLQNVAQLSSVVGLFICLFLGMLTMFIISNTIHLLIQARGREIEILRMMGVGNWYIRLPFLFQGAVYGLVGALIAYFPLALTEYYINQLFQYFQFSTSNYSMGIVLVTMVLMGLLFGSGGALFSVRKYLHI